MGMLVALTALMLIGVGAHAETLEGWKYRIPITITNNANVSLDNYQIRLYLTAQNFTFDLAQPNGSDIRFATLNGTMLPYWIEYWNSTSQEAVVWVKVPYIPKNGSTTIYMYYGNPSANSESNGTATFLFFDDFEDGVVDTNKWYIANGTVSESDGMLVMTRDGGEPYIYIKDKTFTDFFIRTEVKATSSYGDEGILLRVQSLAGIWTEQSGYMAHFGVFGTDTEPYPFKVVRLDSGSYTELQSTDSAFYDDEWYSVEIRVYKSNIKVSINGGNSLSVTDSTYTSGYIGLAGTGSTGTWYWKYFIVSSYVDPEPTVVVGDPEAVEWWNESWRYRERIVITNNVNQALKDYQVRVDLTELNFYWDEARSDGGDIRFVSLNGTVLPYWIEYWNASERKAVVWVKIPEIPANSKAIIYMYYGNPSASSMSNGSSVFLLFDDFNDGVLDGDKWTTVSGGGGSIVEEDGVVKITPDGSNRIYLRTANKYPTPVAVEFSAYLYAPSIETSNIWLHALTRWDGQITGTYDSPNNAMRFDMRPDDNLLRIYVFVNGSYDLLANVSADISLNVWYRVTIADDGTKFKATVEGIGSLEVINDTTDYGYIGFASREQPSTEQVWIDWVAIRNYVDPEPNVSVKNVETIDWWNYSWSYRRLLVVENPAPVNLTDYQVRLYLNSSMIDFSKISENGSDIRFVLPNGTELPYWIEYWNDTTQEAVVWFKVPFIPANGSTTIYMYYGNPSATSESNPDAVFDVYADFEDSPIGDNGSSEGFTPDNSNYWKVVSGNYYEGVLLSDAHTITIHNATGLSDIEIKCKVMKVGGTYNAYIIARYQDDGDGTPEVTDYFYEVQLDFDADYVRIRRRHPTDATVLSEAPYTLASNTWYDVVFRLYGSTLEVYVDGNLITSATDTYYASGQIGLHVYYADIYFDDIIVRKYVDPEPTVAVYPEEQISVVVFEVFSPEERVYVNDSLSYVMPIEFRVTSVSYSSLNVTVLLDGVVIYENASYANSSLVSFNYTITDIGKPHRLEVLASVGETVYRYVREFDYVFRFTVVALPDTQVYSEKYNAIFYNITDWIAQVKDELAIKFVVGLGDIVDDGASNLTEWDVANQSYTTLEVNGIPFLAAIGNHDYDDQANTRSHDTYDKYFNITRFEGKPWFGGAMENDTVINSYGFFEVDGYKFMVMILEFAPRDEVLDWASKVVSQHLDCYVIVATHAYLYYNDERLREEHSSDPSEYGVDGNNGEEIWQKFVSRYPNIFLVLSGHVTGDGTGKRVDYVFSHPIGQTLQDYQAYPNGGNGFIRLYEIRPVRKEIMVRTYSPWLKQYNTSADQEFTLPFDPKTFEKINVSEWSFRQPIEISNSLSKSLRGYAVEVELNSSNVGSGFDWVKDYDRIAFSTEYNISLPYWIKYWNASEKRALIYVYVPYIPANNTTTIYMYYGYRGGGEAPSSNPYEVFPLYEGFDRDTYETLGPGEGIYSVSDGIIDIELTASGSGVDFGVKIHGSVSIDRDGDMMLVVNASILKNGDLFVVGFTDAPTDDTNHYFFAGTQTDFGHPFDKKITELGVWTEACAYLDDINDTKPIVYIGLDDDADSSAEMLVDYVYIRYYASVEPSARLLAEEFIGGTIFSINLFDLNMSELPETVRILILNATTGEVVVSEVLSLPHARFMLPQGNYTIRVLWSDVTIYEKVLRIVDSTVVNASCGYIRIPSDYRGLLKKIGGFGLWSIYDLNPKRPGSVLRMLVDRSPFEIVVDYIGDPPTKVMVVSNVTVSWRLEGTILEITGSASSTAEILVYDLYRLRLEFYDRLGNLMPSWMCVHINAGRYSYKGAIVEDYFYPEDYLIELPLAINGFEFYGFFDGYNETARTVTINHSDVTLKAWYRVPTGFEEVRGAQVSSLWRLPFIEQGGETVKVYVEGYLRDYYGAGVPNRSLVINVTNVETGYTRSFNVTTDVAGHFRSPIIELVRGKTYRVELFYKGDDIYVGSTSTLEVKPEELPLAPVVFLLPTEYLVFGASIAVLGVAVYMAVRASRHAIEDVMERRRKFVKRKRS